MPTIMTTTTTCASGDLAQRLTELRALRNDALTEDDLLKVEERLREVLANLSKLDAQSTTWNNAGIFLATLLLQKGEESSTKEAGVLLAERGFAYRLSVKSLMHNHATPSDPPNRYSASWDASCQILFSHA